MRNNDIEVNFYYFEGTVNSTAPFGHLACSIRDKTNPKNSYYFSITSDGNRTQDLSKYSEKELYLAIDREIGAFKTPFIKKTTLPSVNEDFDKLMEAINIATTANRSNQISPIDNNCAQYIDTILATIYPDIKDRIRTSTDNVYKSVMKNKKPTKLLLPGVVANNVYKTFASSKTTMVPYIDFVKERFNSTIRSIFAYLNKSDIATSLKTNMSNTLPEFNKMVKIINDYKQNQNKDRAQFDQQLTTSFKQLKKSIDTVIGEAKKLHPIKYYLYGLISIFCKDPGLEYCKKFKAAVKIAQKETLLNPPGKKLKKTTTI